jgi:hypothetical protein
VGDERYALFAWLSEFYIGGRYPDVDGESASMLKKTKLKNYWLRQTRRTNGF